ncbi:GDNF-inducible zinc finger protein 1-like isoform X3 [Pseudopipra pipra]|uniref:GDNF-inducible zinc finger protein 1-like isoform X3 n=1 Tax=Pseudopipra pipra TaxID=415032 RepID=UPI0031398650
MCRMGKIIPQNWGSYPQCCSWIPGGEGGVIPAEGIYSSETFRSVPSFIFQTRGCTSEHPIGTGGGWARRVCVRVYTGAARCRRCKSPVSLLIKPSVPPSRVKLVFFRAGETPGFGNQKARGRAAARCLATGGAPVTSLPVRRGRAQGGRGRGASALPAAPGAEREQRPGTRREHAGNAPGTLLAGGRKMESAPVLLESKSSPINLLNEMHQLRLLGHLCDVTVSVEYQGVRAEFVAHKAVLAATSKFFKEVFLNEKAVDGPRSNVFLNEVQVADFASFLEFVYTARVEVEEDRVQRMLEIAEKLKCLDLSETCFQLKKQMLESVLLELQNFSESQNSEEEGAAHPSVPPESKAVAEAEQETPGSPVARPSHGASPEAPAAKSKEKTDKKKEMLKAPYAKIRRASGRLAGRKVFVEIPKKKYTRRLREQQKNAEVAAEDDKYPEDEELCDPEGEEERGEDAAAKPEGAGRDGSPEENRPKAGEDKKKRGSNFKCGTCEKEFLYEKSFLKHIQHSHGIAAELVFRCETCGQTFANRCNLRSHQRHVHSSERRFPCELCESTRGKSPLSVMSVGPGSLRTTCSSITDAATQVRSRRAPRDPGRSRPGSQGEEKKSQANHSRKAGNHLPSEDAFLLLFFSVILNGMPSSLDVVFLRELRTPDNLGYSVIFKLNEGLFKLGTGKKFLPLRVVRHWNSFPREAMDSPFLEVFQAREQPGLGGRCPCPRQDLGLGDL